MCHHFWVPACSLAAAGQSSSCLLSRSPSRRALTHLVQSDEVAAAVPAAAAAGLGPAGRKEATSCQLTR
jgi:hypothetical protein